MKKRFLFLLALCPFLLFSQQKGIGLDIRISLESDVSDDGSSVVEIRDDTMRLGGSFHYFEGDSREYMGSLFLGHNSASNGVSETEQTFLGLGGGVNFPLLGGKLISAGFGGEARLEIYMEPERTPARDYDGYFKGLLALEIPLFLDVAIHEKFLLRFSAVAAGWLMDIQYKEESGIKETLFNMDLYTTTTGGPGDMEWFPFRIYFIYKL